jgi:hypothetical protein
MSSTVDPQPDVNHDTLGKLLDMISERKPECFNLPPNKMAMVTLPLEAVIHPPDQYPDIPEVGYEIDQIEVATFRKGHASSHSSQHLIHTLDFLLQHKVRPVLLLLRTRRNNQEGVYMQIIGYDPNGEDTYHLELSAEGHPSVKQPKPQLPGINTRGRGSA